MNHPKKIVIKDTKKIIEWYICRDKKIKRKKLVDVFKKE